jgi:hypothetical protein
MDIPDWFTEGAKVKIVGNDSGHGFKKGDIVVLYECYNDRKLDYRKAIRDGNRYRWVSPLDVAPIKSLSVKELLGVDL